MSLDEKVIMGNIMAGHGVARWFRRENVKQSIEEFMEEIKESFGTVENAHIEMITAKHFGKGLI